MTASEDAKKELLNKTNVVGAGHADKIKDGQKTGEEALTAFVIKKQSEEELSASDVIPSEVEGTKTDVVEVGRLSIQPQPDSAEQEGGRVDTTSRMRPYPQGASIGHPDVTAGTAGLRLYDEREEEGFVYAEPVGYTNNHVGANVNKAEIGDVILQPGPFDGGQPIDGEYGVGILKDYTELKENEANLIDGCYFDMRGDRMFTGWVLDAGIPTEKARVSKGDTVFKGNTRTTTYREGEVKATDARVRVNYGNGKVLEFKDQIITDSISKGGDSGSAVFKDPKGEVIGSLFAGSSKVTIINKIDNILEETGLYLNPEDVHNDDSGGDKEDE